MAAVGPVRSLYQDSEVEPSASLGGGRAADRGGLSRATFGDQRWESAAAYLRAHGLATEGAVREILLEGAAAFGSWRLSDAALDPLVHQVLGAGGAGLSPGLESWVGQSRAAADAPLQRERTVDLRLARTLTVSGQEPPDPEAAQGIRFRGTGGPSRDRGRGDVMEEWAGVVDAITLRRFKWGLALLMTVVSFANAIWVFFVKYAGILELFTWPIIFARAGGLGAAMLTGLLYLTMARTFMKQFYKFHGVSSKVLMVLDGHKDVHIFLGRCLVVTSAVHVLAHLLSTVPALRYVTAERLNAFLACANREEALSGMPSFDLLQWPACPLEISSEGMGWRLLWQSTPGVTGLMLTGLMALLAWTGRARARSANFERFWYAHNFALVAWPLLMFVHGSNQWIGVGFPLVAFTTSVPLCLYLVDRVGRLLRFYAFGGRAVQIADAVIRPGKDGGPSGALTHLAVTRPTGLWTFAPGMYAFVCLPEYAPLQWHPLTICSGKNDEYVEFIVAGVGDWTQELAARCLGAQGGSAPLPRIALDGPYAAPAQMALSRPILVAVGAGVGITPFLSLMSSLISLIEDSSESKALPLKEAHFFWVTRSVDEFLFGRRHLTRIAQSHRLRQKVHLHLHATARESDKDPAAYLFREAVKRQSKVDQAAFSDEFDTHRVLTAPQLPWCWVNGSELDVMWLSDLTTASSDMEEEVQARQPISQTLKRIELHVSKASDPSRRLPPLTSVLDASLASRPSSRSSPAGRSPPAGRQLPPGSQDWAESLLWSQSRLRGRSQLARSGVGLRADSAAGHGVPAAAAEGSGGPPAEGPGGAGGAAPLVPVAFGRPDFETELRAIGMHWGCQEKVHIYVCGND
ncbi:unnamed protein product, partial [Prorocentrum cordatum]